jgi:hypothetical protein
MRASVRSAATPLGSGCSARPVDAISRRSSGCRLHSELRGWGQRDFPHYHHTVEPDPIDMPVAERLIGELATLLRTHGLGDTDPPASQRNPKD